MKKAILGKKIGMTQLFRADGTMIPVTVVEAGPCPVVQKKTVAKEGYDADLVLFNKDTINATATYTDPYLPNEGIHMVFVGGKAAVVDNELTGVMEGKKILYGK